MQCMASGWAAQAIASGSKVGASMTISRNPAVQRKTSHIAGQHTSTQYPVASTQFSESAVCWALATGYWVLIPVPFLRARAGRAVVEDNSEAGIDSRGGPLGGSGFRWGGFCGFALPAAGVAGRVGDRAVGCACKSQTARRRGGRGRAVCREVGAAARARTACLRGAG